VYIPLALWSRTGLSTKFRLCVSVWICGKNWKSYAHRHCPHIFTHSHLPWKPRSLLAFYAPVKWQTFHKKYKNKTKYVKRCKKNKEKCSFNWDPRGWEKWIFWGKWLQSFGNKKMNVCEKIAISFNYTLSWSDKYKTFNTWMVIS